MGFSIRATASNGETIEAKVSHYDLIRATYGLDETVKLSSVITFTLSIAVAFATLGGAIFAEELMVKALLLTISFQLFGYQIAGTARTRHMVKTLADTSSNSYLPYMAASLSTYATGAAAAALCLLGGPLGIASGVALVLLNPIARSIGDIGFKIRIWKAERNERNAIKKEGLGG